MKFLKYFLMTFLVFLEALILGNAYKKDELEYIPYNNSCYCLSNYRNNLGLGELKFKNRNFMFQENENYNLFNSKKIAWCIKNYYLSDDDTRTVEGINLELQLHYILYFFNNKHSLDGAYLGVADYNLDWSAALCEDIVSFFR